MTEQRLYDLPGSHNITAHTLSSGISIFVHENHNAQSVVLAGSVQAGSIFESPAQSGLAALAAGSLMRGTRHATFDQIHEQLEGLGASLSVSGGTQQAQFYGKALAEDLPILVNTLADALRYPAFPVDQVERLRGETLTALKIREQNTRYRAGRAFREALYPPDHPYHYNNSGSPETLAGLTVDDLHAFHQRCYGPRQMQIVIVGAVSTPHTLDMIRQAFDDWQPPAQAEPNPLPDLAPLTSVQQISIGIPGKSQADIVLGVRGPARSAPDFLAASLANSVMGQFGMMGRIGAVVREQLGLAYYASSSLQGGMGPRPWSISAGVDPQNVPLALERIHDEINRMRAEPVSPDDLADNQAYYTGHLPLQLESSDGIAGAILNMTTYDLGLDYLVHYRQQIDSLTRDDLLAAVQRYWQPEAIVTAIAGPDSQ